MQEIWNDIVDFEGYYQISNLGNFRRHPNKQCKTSKNPMPLKRAVSINRLGYPYVDLCVKNKKSKKTVHQLVAAAFLPNFIYGMHINHIDGIKTNNCVNNLEITTSILNNTHAHANGLMPKPGKSQYYNVSVRVDKRYKYNPKISYTASVKIYSKRHYIGTYFSEIEAAKAVDTFLNSIGDTIRQRNFP